MKTDQWKLIWEAGDAPIFEMGHGTVFCYKKQKQYFGYSTKSQILFAKNEVVSSYHTAKDLKESLIHGLKFYSDDKAWKQFLNGIKKIQHKNKLLEEKIETMLVKNDKDRTRMGKLLLEVSDAQIFTFCHFNMTNPNFTSGPEEKLRRYLKEIVNGTIDEVLGTLTTSKKLSTLQVETLELYHILYKHQDETEKMSPRLIKDLEKHSRKYLYLGGNEGNDKWDLEYYLGLTKQILNKPSFNLKEEIRKIERYSEKAIAEKKKVIEKYQIDSIHKDIADKLAEIGHARLELRIIWSSQYRMLRKIVYQISKVLEIPAYDLLVCSPKELYDWFVLNKKLRKEKVLDRQKAYIFILNNGKIKAAYGNEAISLKQKLIPDMDFSKTKMVEGKAAYPGLIKGKAFVFNWGSDNFNKQINNMPEDAVLVTGQTRPSLMPAIRKASAIITDEGGITSHAAIISRELKIPCVIGTEFATKIFKTGDLIEVDAYKGVARLES
jgi:phosphohistidine swiveling domain-containing protein